MKHFLLTSLLFCGTLSEHQPHTVSFIGAFPEQNPEYTLLVLLKKVPYPSSAKIQCAEPMRYIAERIYYKK